MKKILSIIAIGFSLSMSIQAKEIKINKQYQHSIVINLAGKQRMLTQKMSKEALLIAKGIDVESNTKSLKKTITLFDKTLIGLRDGDKSLKLPKTNNREIVKQIDKVIALWKNFKIHISKVVNGKIEKATLVAIDKENIPLLQNMNMVVEMYENDSDSHLDPQMAKTINLAGRQRMLTQKMTKELLLIANKLKSNANIESLKSTGELFKDTLTDLMTNNKEAMKDPDIAKRLVTVQTLWSEYQNVIANTGVSKREQQESKEKQDEISQKMTKELLTIANRVDAQEYTKNLKKTGELFDKTLTGLIKGDADLGLMGTKDEAITKQLIKVQNLWFGYKDIISNADVSDKGLKKAIAINIPLLKNMNKAVEMYEESVK
ncbi:Nitric oxide-responding transcriptional regulator Dnr (Crp/Fnr family) [hydrothermal vent metagenome]|uniref:Nitric oxide-responding transcriptional regulator Dnr (Crp/Fnr family) n=1 Tax=hydrothermal vent metagenome TaxID=652676 RepID=A0A1W1BNU6_9ZZZZ